MVYRFNSVYRLEPTHSFTDLRRGLAAEIADPAWFLARQWQLGEHEGEDASSPVHVALHAEVTAIQPTDNAGGADPAQVPTEAIVEAQPDDFWTPGRRVAVGRGVDRAARDTGRPLPDDPALRLADLPTPYDLLNGTGFDGRALFHARTDLDLDLDWFEELPPDPPPSDLWNPAELAYDADFRAGAATLRLRRHDGGDLDWWSVDAAGPVPEPGPPPESPPRVLASRLRYPGAPHPRWWQVEDDGTDLGAYAPDRSHFATLLLLELVASHTDDLFTFPLQGDSGHVVTLHRAAVVDSFGEEWPIEPPDDGWTMFTVAGLGPRSVVLWAAVGGALTGPVIDQVDLGVDEDANLLWAVERRVRGRDLATPERPSAPITEAQADAGVQPSYAYRPSLEVPPFWHPYVPETVTVAGQVRRRFVQGRLADLSGDERDLMDAPISDLLFDPASGGRHPVHQLEPAAVPTDGLQIERRYMLARRVDGLPVLWTQRRRVPLAAPPTMRLQFDVLEAT
jgi:hypothetical protein